MLFFLWFTLWNKEPRNGPSWTCAGLCLQLPSLWRRKKDRKKASRWMLHVKSALPTGKPPGLHMWWTVFHFQDAQRNQIKGHPKLLAKSCVWNFWPKCFRAYRQAENIHQGLSDIVKATHIKSLFNKEGSFYIMLLLYRSVFHNVEHSQKKKSENVLNFICKLVFKCVLLMHLACPFGLLERVRGPLSRKN